MPRFQRYVFSCLCAFACGGEPTQPSGPPVLTAVSGPQEGRVAQRLPAPLSVRASNASGKPAPGVVVHWRVDAGSLSDSVSSTDANGLATAGTVYQDTLATAQGVLGFTATLPITVNNVNTDVIVISGRKSSTQREHHAPPTDRGARSGAGDGFSREHQTAARVV